MSLNLSPADIYYTQKSISNKFKNGKTLDDVINGLVTGKMKLSDIPQIRVVLRDNKWWSLDNRRLYVFKQVQMRSPNVNFEIPVNQVPIDEKEWKKKFTTTNGGTSIKVRGGATQMRLLGGAVNYGGDDFDSEDDLDDADLFF